MYCQECGTKTPDSAKFCPECGRKLPRIGESVEERHKRVYTIKTALTDYFQGTICETKLREMIRRGQIPHTRADTRIILREGALDKWLAEQEQA